MKPLFASFFREKMFGDKAIDKWRSVEVSGMSFYQYIEAPLTTRNILSLSGELSTQNGTGIELNIVKSHIILRHCIMFNY